MQRNGTDTWNEFPDDVEAAISTVMPSSDPLDSPQFNPIDYINTIFPSEHSLNNLNNVMVDIKTKISVIDEDMRFIVRSPGNQTASSALGEAQSSILLLFSQIRGIQRKASDSEEIVKEITKDIKRLDAAKRNLTSAITTLNHLHMLVEGINQLKSFTSLRQYKDAAMLLNGLMSVVAHFKLFMGIPQIKNIFEEIELIKHRLGQQIVNDFENWFTSEGSTSEVLLTEGCLVVSVLDPSIKEEIMKYFINQQLEEYILIFKEGEEAWVDQIENRFSWLKQHLIEFENSQNRIFPIDWQMSENIAKKFCEITKDGLEKILLDRKNEITAKLLMQAISRTSSFEFLLCRRFDSETKKNSFLKVISPVFEPYLYIYLDSQDESLSDLVGHAAEEQKKNESSNFASEGSLVLHSCGNLFMFYKKCLQQCSQLSTGQPMVQLCSIFKKYLNEYATKVIINNFPNLRQQDGMANNFSNFKKEALKDFSQNKSGLFQNISNFLVVNQEDDGAKLTSDDKVLICTFILTLEYCLETTQQLEIKMKDKIDENLKKFIDFGSEQTLYHSLISNCMRTLVTNLENLVSVPLNHMTKMAWSSLECVGDQSPYVNSIANIFEENIPILRDNLTSSKKYFMQFCIKFVNSFIYKYINSIYKCKPLGTVGAEQLLLDTHSIKMILLNFPSVKSLVHKKSPGSYAKIVIKEMAKAEMTLKVVMSPGDTPSKFVEQYIKLIPEANVADLIKILDMKGIKKTGISSYINAYNASYPSNSIKAKDTKTEESDSRIKKLENLMGNL